MNKLIWNLLKVTPAVLGLSLMTANSGFAQTVDSAATEAGETFRT